MSIYTQADLDAINKALIGGESLVKYQDKEVRYRSLADLKEIRDIVMADLGILQQNNGPLRVIAVHSKGLG